MELRRCDKVPALSALVAAALVLATTTLVVVTFTTARAAGVIDPQAYRAYGRACDLPTVEAVRGSALASCHTGDRKVTQVRH